MNKAIAVDLSDTFIALAVLEPAIDTRATGRTP